MYKKTIPKESEGLKYIKRVVIQRDNSVDTYKIERRTFG